MKISDKPTENILIKANTDSEWDCCEFAIIHLSEEWSKRQAKWLEAIKPFKDDYNFQSMKFYDCSVEFFQAGGDEELDVEELLADREWAFVKLDNDELDKLTSPENSLDFYKIAIYRDGNARYEAFGKHTNEEFWTNEFPLQHLIDRCAYNREDMTFKTETPVSLVADFANRIHTLRKDILSNIVSILQENRLSEIDFKGIITDMTDVLWCEGNGTWHDSPVTSVSLTGKGISLTVEDADEEVTDTLDSENFDLAFTNPVWIASIRDNILEAIDVTKHLKNDIQFSLFKEWNIYADNNEEEPRYASVSIRFKDDGSEKEVIISLTGHSAETGEHVFHYVHSLQELIELADTDKESTVQNFIIIGFNEYSDTLHEE